MTNNARVFHVTRKFWMKFGQVERAIEKSCSFVWVIYGEQFRDATPQEAIEMRNEQAKLAEPLPFAEIPGLIYRPTANAEAATREEYRLAAEANRFAAENAA